MVKKRRILFTFIIIMMCIVMTFAAFACDKDNSDDSDDDSSTETEETLLFTNGDFTKTSSSSNSLYTASNWTGNPGSTSTSSSLKTPQGSDNLLAGVISSKNYDKSKFGNKSFPGTKGSDKNVLMIYNKVDTSYFFKSSSATLEKNKYYKLTFYVKTVEISSTGTDEYGAYAFVNGDAYAGFEAINTNGEWKQYTTYFRSSATKDGSITLSLGLGNGNLETGHMTKGYAYFDNVVLTDLTDVEEGSTAFTEADFNAVSNSDVTVKYDMLYADSNFNFASATTSTPYTPAQYTGKGGTGSGTSASTSSSYVEKGIIDISENGGSYTFSALGSEATTLTKVNASDLGDRMLYIHNKQLTAYSYTDKVGMSIANGSKHYEITVAVKTILVEGKATVKLTNGTEELAKIGDIDTNGEWSTIHFYIEGNEYTKNTLYICLALGTGGSGDNDWAKGVAFFDDLTFSEISADAYTDASGAKYSYATTEGTCSFTFNDYRLASETTIPSTYSTNAVVDTANWDSSAYSSIENPGSVLASNTNILVINNSRPTAVTLDTIASSTDYKVETILPNACYLLSFWVKTVNIDKATGVTFNLVQYTKDGTNPVGTETVLSTASAMNSENLEDYIDDAHNGYTRISFYVLGAEKDTANVGLQIVFGTATTGLESSKFASGYVFISQLSFTAISYTNYTSATTSTVSFTKSLGGSGASSELSANGYFNYVDLSTTYSTYPDCDSVTTSDGKLAVLAAPTSWTSTNSDALSSTDSKAGILDLTNSDLLTELSIDASNFYNGIDGTTMTTEDYSKVLYIDAKGVTSLGYTSQSISLSAKSFYVISVYAKCTQGYFSINVSPTTVSDTDVTNYYYTNSSVGNNWNQYKIYIRTGLTSSSVKVTLYAGSPSNEVTATESKVFFTGAAYSTITEAIFNNAKSYVEENATSTSKVQEWFVDTMDSSSSSFSEALSTPSNWTGAQVDSSASTDAEDLAKGLFNRTTGDWSNLDIDPDTADSIANEIYADDSITGDTVLVIYNKNANSYKYTSTSFTLEAGKYYEISLLINTKDLAYLTKSIVDEKDDDVYDNWTDKKLAETATITLTVNNKKYVFGKSIKKAQASTDFDTAAEYADYQLDQSRLVNTDGSWVEYKYYIALDEDIKDSVSGSLSIALGGKNVSYWEAGYVFIDNFSVVEMDETEYTTASATLNEEDESYDATARATGYRITYTNNDATADAEEDDDDDNNTSSSNPEAKNMLWLYITSGVIGGVLVIVIVIYLIKRYAPKRKLTGKSKKKTLTKDNSRRGKFEQ